MKKIRNILVALSAICICSMAGGIVSIDALANTQSDPFASFSIVEGASVRYGAIDGNNGIRFAIKMNPSDYATVQSTYTDVTTGVLIAPEAYYDTYKFNEENVFGENAKYYDLNDENAVKTGKAPIYNFVGTLSDGNTPETTGYKAYSGSIVNILDGYDDVTGEASDEANNVALDFRAVGYIRYTTKGESPVTAYKFVTSDKCVRSMATVAESAIASGDANSTALQSMYIDRVDYVLGCKTAKAETISTSQGKTLSLPGVGTFVGGYYVDKFDFTWELSDGETTETVEDGYDIAGKVGTYTLTCTATPKLGVTANEQVVYTKTITMESTKLAVNVSNDAYAMFFDADGAFTMNAKPVSYENNQATFIAADDSKMVVVDGAKAGFIDNVANYDASAFTLYTAPYIVGGGYVNGKSITSNVPTLTYENVKASISGKYTLNKQPWTNEERAWNVLYMPATVTAGDYVYTSKVIATKLYGFGGIVVTDGTSAINVSFITATAATFIDIAVTPVGQHFLNQYADTTKTDFVRIQNVLESLPAPNATPAYSATFSVKRTATVMEFYVNDTLFMTVTSDAITLPEAYSASQEAVTKFATSKATEIAGFFGENVEQAVGFGSIGIAGTADFAVNVESDKISNAAKNKRFEVFADSTTASEEVSVASGEWTKSGGKYQVVSGTLNGTYNVIITEENKTAFADNVTFTDGKAEITATPTRYLNVAGSATVNGKSLTAAATATTGIIPDTYEEIKATATTGVVSLGNDVVVSNGVAVREAAYAVLLGTATAGNFDYSITITGKATTSSSFYGAFGFGITDGTTQIDFTLHSENTAVVRANINDAGIYKFDADDQQTKSAYGTAAINSWSTLGVTLGSASTINVTYRIVKTANEIRVYGGSFDLYLFSIESGGVIYGRHRTQTGYPITQTTISQLETMRNADTTLALYAIAPRCVGKATLQYSVTDNNAS